jgi:transposase
MAKGRADGERELMARHRSDPRRQLLATIPGVGPIAALSFALGWRTREASAQGRRFAAGIGITPPESSTGGRHRPGKISRPGDRQGDGQGDENLRRLLVLGASAVIPQAKPGRATTWLSPCLARKPKKLAAVALANKLARPIWAMLISGELYRRPVAA